MLEGGTRQLIFELARQVLHFRARVLGAAALLILAKVAAVTVPLVLPGMISVRSSTAPVVTTASPGRTRPST